LIFSEEPCEQANCALGESCFMEAGRATCRCPESCSSSYAAVCGNDGVTYSNECLLRMHACQSRNSVQMKHPGECSKSFSFHFSTFKVPYFHFVFKLKKCQKLSLKEQTSIPTAHTSFIPVY